MLQDRGLVFHQERPYNMESLGRSMIQLSNLLKLLQKHEGYIGDEELITFFITQGYPSKGIFTVPNDVLANQFLRRSDFLRVLATNISPIAIPAYRLSREEHLAKQLNQFLFEPSGHSILGPFNNLGLERIESPRIQQMSLNSPLYLKIVGVSSVCLILLSAMSGGTAKVEFNAQEKSFSMDFSLPGPDRVISNIVDAIIRYQDAEHERNNPKTDPLG